MIYLKKNLTSLQSLIYFHNNTDNNKTDELKCEDVS